MPIITTSVHFYSGDHSQRNKARKIKKEIKSIRTGQENETFVICREHDSLPRESKRMYRQVIRMNKSSKVTGDSVQKSIVFLHVSTSSREKENLKDAMYNSIKKTSPNSIYYCVTNYPRT